MNVVFWAAKLPKRFDNLGFGSLLAVLVLHAEIQRVNLPVENAKFVNEFAIRIVAREANLKPVVGRGQRFCFTFQFIELELELSNSFLISSPERVPFR